MKDEQAREPVDLKTRTKAFALRGLTTTLCAQFPEIVTVMHPRARRRSARSRERISGPRGSWTLSLASGIVMIMHTIASTFHGLPSIQGGHH